MHSKSNYERLWDKDDMSDEEYEMHCTFLKNLNNCLGIACLNNGEMPKNARKWLNEQDDKLLSEIIKENNRSRMH